MLLLTIITITIIHYLYLLLPALFIHWCDQQTYQLCFVSKKIQLSANNTSRSFSYMFWSLAICHTHAHTDCLSLGFQLQSQFSFHFTWYTDCSFLCFFPPFRLVHIGNVVNWKNSWNSRKAFILISRWFKKIFFNSRPYDVWHQFSCTYIKSMTVFIDVFFSSNRFSISIKKKRFCFASFKTKSYLKIRRQKSVHSNHSKWLSHIDV